ncbi:MAG: DUF1844 domain-containing protein [Actinobacteria bacterium]|nr:DUF1844 domain-containing protein [Actinomycetota bacterium]
MAKDEEKKQEDLKGQEEKPDDKNEREKQEEILRQLKEELEKLTVKDIVFQMMVSLSSLGYEKLGLPKETNAAKKDIVQAKLAIDCLSALIDVCEKSMKPEELSSYKAAAANLKISFVKESSS